MSRPPRIIHVPGEFGVNSYGLSRAERELGFESDVAVFRPSPWGYGYDFDLRAGVDRPVWLRMARRAVFLGRALRRYDVFHFNFGLTLLTVRQLGLVVDELALVRRLGKTILFTYQGSDVRPGPAANRYLQPAANRAVRFADRVFYLNPDLCHWLPGARFLPYANVDPRVLLPTALPEWDELVVAHAPTNREVKGTEHVIRAVEQLRSEGVAIRLDLVEGTTREEVFERIRKADVVVDQLLIGWYGGLAVESMALGRPVLAYIEEAEPGDNPFGQELPIVRVTPQTLADELRALAHDPERRAQLAKASRAFVERHHDPLTLARGALDGLVPLPERR
jgi:glycosyltransferase involved in cell wall biosynthesis